MVPTLDPDPGNRYGSAQAFLLMLKNCHGFRRYKLIRDEAGNWRDTAGRLILKTY